MAVMSHSEKRDLLGVLKLADDVTRVGSRCAFGVVHGSDEAAELAAAAVEGVAVNAVFGHAMGRPANVQGSTVTVLTGPMVFLRLFQHGQIGEV